MATINEMRILGGYDVHRAPAVLYLSHEPDGSVRLPNGARIGVIEGDDQALMGWGELDGPARHLALDFGYGWERRDDMTAPVSELQRLALAGVSLPSVTACCGKSPLDCLYHDHKN